MIKTNYIAYSYTSRTESCSQEIGDGWGGGSDDCTEVS